MNVSTAFRVLVDTAVPKLDIAGVKSSWDFNSIPGKRQGRHEAQVQ